MNGATMAERLARALENLANAGKLESATSLIESLTAKGKTSHSSTQSCAHSSSSQCSDESTGLPRK